MFIPSKLDKKQSIECRIFRIGSPPIEIREMFEGIEKSISVKIKMKSR